MKRTLCVLFTITFLALSLFSESIKFFTPARPDLTTSAELAAALKQDFRSSPIRFEQTFSADFKELFLDCGYSIQASKFDFVNHINYMPTFFHCFRAGIGVGYHFYRYFDTFTENDILFSTRFKWCRTDFFNMEVAAGFMMKFALIDSIRDYSPIIDNYCFTFEYLCNWNLNPLWTVYASLASFDYFDYPLFGTPFFKGGASYHIRDNLAIDASLAFKFIDMVVSTAYCSQCILKAGVKYSF